MPRAISYLFLPGFLLGLLVLGCGGASASAASTPQPVTLPAASTTAAPPSASSQDMCTSTPASAPCAASSSPPVSTGPRLCGCALCEPVLSDDACKVDADCLPATPCHARACVAAAHAQPRAPGVACTEEFRCDSVDANRCGCVRGRCALAPK